MRSSTVSRRLRPAALLIKLPRDAAALRWVASSMRYDRKYGRGIVSRWRSAIERANSSRIARSTTLPVSGLDSRGGGGRMGGRSDDLGFFWISICEIRMPGDTADTGTYPDSAP